MPSELHPEAGIMAGAVFVAAGVALVAFPEKAQALAAAMRKLPGGSVYPEAWTRPTKGYLLYNRLVGVLALALGGYLVLATLGIVR